MIYEHVVWRDSGLHIHDGWQTLDDAMKDWHQDKMIVHTVGIVADDREDVLILGLSLDRDNMHWFGLQVIYKKNIISREVLNAPTE